MKNGLIACLAVIALPFSLLTACDTVNDLNPFGGLKKGTPTCPSVKFLKDADRITVYKPNTSREISDIIFEAEFTGFKGECEYFGEDSNYNSVLLSLNLSLDIIRGPAAKTPNIELNYFIAIPDFFPNPKGKVHFNRVLKFPKGSNSANFVDETIEITIPLNKNRRGPKTKVLIGFDLSKSQLEFNREPTRGMGLGG